MWTQENRARYDRNGLRYPSDLTDAEWAVIAPLIPPGKRGGDKRRVNLREVLNGLLYVLSTDCQWRAILKDLPPRSTVHGYFDLWTWDGTITLNLAIARRHGLDALAITSADQSRNINRAHPCPRLVSEGIEER